MKYFAAAILAGALVTVVAAEHARPNLAGTWKIDTSQAPATSGGRGGGNGRGNSRGGGVGLGLAADTLVITQNYTAVTIEERYGSVRNVVVLPVDGKKSTNQVGVGRGAGIPVEFTSRWKDNFLLATFSVPVQGQAPRQYEQTFALGRKDGGKDNDVLLLQIKEVGTTNSRTAIYRR